MSTQRGQRSNIFGYVFSEGIVWWDTNTGECYVERYESEEGEKHGSDD